MDWLKESEDKRFEPKTLQIDVIPTIYDEFNIAIGIGGIPKGKIIEISGMSKSCKSALLLDIVASAQKLDISPIYLDTDCKFDSAWAKEREVDCDNLLVFRPDPKTPERTVEAIQKLADSGLFYLIIIDSISNYGDQMEVLLSNLEKIIANTNLTVIMSSQIRHNFEHPRDYKTPYMKILNQYCNIRMYIKPIESIKHCGILIAKKVSLDIYKNSLANPKSTEFTILV